MANHVGHEFRRCDAVTGRIDLLGRWQIGPLSEDKSTNEHDERR